MRALLRQAPAFLLAFVALTACTGAEGPAGPQGEQGAQGVPGPIGPQGPSGSGLRATYLVTIESDGYAQQILPTTFGASASQPPLLVCFLAETPTDGGWVPASDGYPDAPDTYCALSFFEGRWYAVLYNGPPGWTVAFSVLGF